MTRRVAGKLRISIRSKDQISRSFDEPKTAHQTSTRLLRRASEQSPDTRPLKPTRENGLSTSIHQLQACTTETSSTMKKIVTPRSIRWVRQGVALSKLASALDRVVHHAGCTKFPLHCGIQSSRLIAADKSYCTVAVRSSPLDRGS
jgi:hypothetical protein